MRQTSPSTPFVFECNILKSTSYTIPINTMAESPALMNCSIML
jgi:hypothetical protein